RSEHARPVPYSPPSYLTSPSHRSRAPCPGMARDSRIELARARARTAKRAIGLLTAPVFGVAFVGAKAHAPGHTEGKPKSLGAPRGTAVRVAPLCAHAEHRTGRRPRDGGPRRPDPLRPVVRGRRLRQAALAAAGPGARPERRRQGARRRRSGGDARRAGLRLG